MEVIKSQNSIGHAQEFFSSSVAAQGTETETVSLGFQSGHYDTKLLWLPEYGYWAYFGVPPEEKSPGDRYWNVFGLGKPSGQVAIGCEINPPLRGIKRQVAGLFLRDRLGKFHLAHRGILNARGRIKKDFVFSSFRGKKLTVEDDGQSSLVLHIGRLGDDVFVESLGRFIFEAARIKELARDIRSI